uniref:Tail protein n=1 Tax=viral metagenome TaxID=1070528 RepID=A0A6M3JZU6_9ZZZZ
MDILGAVRKWFSGAFTGLSDVPNFTGQAGKYLRIKATEDGLETGVPAGGGTPGDIVVAETAYGQSPTAGAATEYSRSDHSHGTTDNTFVSHDHSGATEGTSLVPATLRVPNGAGGTTVDAAGEICVDTTSKTVNFYDGAAEAVLNPTLDKSFVILDPVGTDDWPLWRAPVAITLVQIDYLCLGGTNWIGQLQECDANGINGADVQAADTTATSAGGNVQVVSFSNASIDAGDYVGIKSTSISGTPTCLVVTFRYRQNP